MEPKSKSMLIVDPPTELRFSGPFTRPVITVMTLANPSDNIIVFKIKTTAPKRYCVRPNFGTVLPRSSSRVEICLQPFAYDPNEKNKHKFMVQSLAVQADDEIDISKAWKDADQEQLMDAKLKCVFEMPAITSKADSTGSDTTDIKTVQETAKLGNEDKISNVSSQASSDTFMNELKQTRDENRGLREENINLKEQVMRLRCCPMQVEEAYTPMAPKQIPPYFIFIAIAAVLLGLLLGKFLL